MFEVICLMGPTASGKTQLAVELAKRFPVEIISVDSAMVYREMDIGTAKPSADILKIAPHRLIDICDPADAYSVARFRTDALREIDQVIKQNKIPLLVGGTMLYFRILQKGLNDLPVANASVRLALQEQADQIGWPALHDKLLQIDVTAANRIHPHDSQRIQRALEVYEVTGKTMTEWQEQPITETLPYKMRTIILSPADRSVLHERIEQRFNEMLEKGFVAEVKKLFERGDLSLQHPSMRSVGYRQVWEHLLGKLNASEMREQGIIATRQFAKRQLTWLRAWEDAQWVDSLRKDVLDEAIRILPF